MTFINDHSRHNIFYLLKSKDKPFTKFKHYKAMIEKQTKQSIVKLKTDRGGYDSSKEFIRYLQEEGIQTEQGPAQQPMENGVAKRFNSMLLSRIRSQFFSNRTASLSMGRTGAIFWYANQLHSIQYNKQQSTYASISIPHTDRQTPVLIPASQTFWMLSFCTQSNRSSKVALISNCYIFVGI